MRTPRVYVAPVSFGLGDLVVSLPAVQALVARGQRRGDETWLVARSRTQARLAERIAGLAGCVDDDAFDRDSNRDRFFDLRDHPLQRDWWWGSPAFEAAFGRLSINDILGRICADFGIEADFDDPQPLDALPRPDVSSCVLFVTDSDGPSKCWPAERWAALAADIRELGLDTRVVTRDGVEPELAALGIESIVAPTPGDAVDVLTAARAVIGIDTGLTHIAVQQGTPTVTIARASTVFFRPWPHARVIFGDRCDDRCTALEEEYAYNERVDLRGFRWQPRACPVGGRCLDPVRPAHVFDALEQVL